jgi:hypothetical protein
LSGLGPIKKIGDLRNFQKKSENFEATILVRKVRKIIQVMFWLGLLIRSLEMFFKTVSYEHNWKNWLAILSIIRSDKNSDNFSGYF